MDAAIFVEVESIEPMEYFIYQIIGNDGQIYDSKRLLVPQRTYHVFDFPATYDLLPSAKIVVLFYEGFETVSAQTDLTIDTSGYRLDNFIDVNLSQNFSTPGEYVNISISSIPMSFVALTGVDQSVLLMRKNDDITVGNVINELGNYHTKTSQTFFRNDFGSVSMMNV